MRQKVAKRIRQEMIGAEPGSIRRAKREYVRNRGRQFPKLKLSKRQQRLAEKNN